MATIETRTYTPDDLLAMPGGDRYELIDGELRERQVSVLPSWVGGRLFRLLADFVEDRRLGRVWPADNGLQCFPGAPQRVRKSDASFVRAERIPDDWTQQGYLRIAPDLVVEVISPGDLAYEVDGKVLEYLKAGVRLIWVVNPQARTVRVHRADGSVDWLTKESELSGEQVIAGFRCPVQKLFASLPETAAKE